jgi:hypothetical protein
MKQNINFSTINDIRFFNERKIDGLLTISNVEGTRHDVKIAKIKAVCNLAICESFVNVLKLNKDDIQNLKVIFIPKGSPEDTLFKKISKSKISDEVEKIAQSMTKFTCSDDISSFRFAIFLSQQIRETPKSDDYGDRSDLCDDYRVTPSNSQSEVQKRHVVTWFAANGEIPEKKKYNLLSDPAALLWIAEAVGANPKDVEDAKKNADENRKCENPSVKTQSKKIIDKIPFDKIYDQLQK